MKLVPAREGVLNAIVFPQRFQRFHDVRRRRGGRGHLLVAAPPATGFQSVGKVQDDLLVGPHVVLDAQGGQGVDQGRHGVDDVAVNGDPGVDLFLRRESGVFAVVDRVQELHLFDDGRLAAFAGPEEQELDDVFVGVVIAFELASDLPGPGLGFLDTHARLEFRRRQLADVTTHGGGGGFRLKSSFHPNRLSPDKKSSPSGLEPINRQTVVPDYLFVT